MIGTLVTGFGFWNPLVWVVVIAVSSFISWFIWRCGKVDYEVVNSEALVPYLSGNAEPKKGFVHIRAGNMYWGFTKALSTYYNYFLPLHPGLVTDYLSWFLIGLITLFVMVMFI